MRGPSLQTQKGMSPQTNQHILFDEFKIEKERLTDTLNRVKELLVE